MKIKFLELGVSRKVVGSVENYLDMKFQLKVYTRSRENEEKLIFLYKKSQFLASKWVKMKFLELGVNRKVVGNVENYLNMQFQPKIFTRSRENAEKPHFLKIAYKKNLRFFGGNRALLPFSPYNELTLCTKAKKSLDPNSGTRMYGPTN